MAAGWEVFSVWHDTKLSDPSNGTSTLTLGPGIDGGKEKPSLVKSHNLERRKKHMSLEWTLFP